jgi:hypothetical protein
LGRTKVIWIQNSEEEATCGMRMTALSSCFHTHTHTLSLSLSLSLSLCTFASSLSLPFS